MPQYEIGELPDGFSENPQKGFCTAGMSVHYYEDKDGEAIVLRYMFNSTHNQKGLDHKALLEHLKDRDPAYYYTDILVPNGRTLSDFIRR